MSIPRVVLVDQNGHVLDIVKFSLEGADIPVLVTTTPQKTHGVFTSASWTGVQAATVLVEPDGDGSIELTDLIVTAGKKNTGTILIQLIDDDSNTAEILSTNVSDGHVNIAIPFAGKFQGWRSARVEFTIGAASDGGSITIGYVKHMKEGSLTYSDWDAQR